MSKRTRTPCMGLSVSLVAPVGALCEMVALHVRDGMALLGVAGCTVEEWLGVVCPHGLSGGWVHVVWRDREGPGLSARFRFDADGEVTLDGVESGASHELTAGCEGEAGEPLLVLSVVSSGAVPYVVGDAMAWVLAHEKGEALRLGRGGGRCESGFDAWDVLNTDAAPPMVGCEFGEDPERN